jgi:xanthine dehydrogenase YagR molybdenum-binding subunit
MADPTKPSVPRPGRGKKDSAPPNTRNEELIYGIVGDSTEKVVKHLPLDEPPPLAENRTLSSVGKSIPRLDAVQKVTGRARYTFDVKLAGMLHAELVVSTLPHARIKAIDTAAAERYPGVRAVHVLGRLLGGAALRDPKAEGEARYPTVRYAGQPLAAVAAETPRAAAAAVRLVRIEYEALPHVTGLEAAMQEGSPLVYPGPTEQAATAGGGGATPGLPQKGNVRGPDSGQRGGSPPGDVEQGLAEADVVVEGEYRTQVQTHVPLETHGVVADWSEEGLTLYASTQWTASVRDEAAELFELPKANVRVVSEFVGGGFGAKYGLGNHGVLAVELSRKARAPVKLMLDRREEHVSAGNRPSSLQRLKIGAKSDGTLTAIKLEAYGSGGIAAGAGVGFAHSTLYPCPNVLTEQYDVFTNTGPSAAFRAPGQVQGIFALEQAIDELAERLGLDPLVLRDKIDTRDADDARARAVERRIGRERSRWSERRPNRSDPGPILRGLGMAQSHWLYLVHNATACEVRINSDGSVEAFSATQDIGTGTRTVLAQVVAEELGIQPEEVLVRIGDTRFPGGPPSGGSRVTSSLTPAARNAAYRVARELAARVAPVLATPAENVVFRNGRVFVRGTPPEGGIVFKEAVRRAEVSEISRRAERTPDYDGYASQVGPLGISRHGIGGVQFAEVAVDTETGVVKVERIVAVHDCGRPINPRLVESQIYGGVIQGVSYALYEERHIDAKTGQQLNANVDQYKIVLSREVPEIEVHVLEQLGAQSSTDARGGAEPANIATAAAIANAFYNATGKRIRSLPLSPPNVIAALRA